MSDVAETSEAPPPVETAITALQRHYRELHDACGVVVTSSLTLPHSNDQASSHVFLEELAQWTTLVSHRRESQLLSTATTEYQYGLLAVVQGQYRQAFKSLRLSLELVHQAVYLSANELELREWLSGHRDTVWAATLDAENGALSLRFVRMFAPDLEEHVKHYRSLVAQVYRECSECIHGNVPKHIPLPGTIQFDPSTFALWHSKASILALTCTFVLSMRYLD